MYSTFFYESFNKTTADIVIEEDKSTAATTPKILFVGTLCGAHGLTEETVWTALAATAQYGDVDCYLYRNGWSGGTVERIYYASIPMLTLKRGRPETAATYFCTRQQPSSQ